MKYTKLEVLHLCRDIANDFFTKYGKREGAKRAAARAVLHKDRLVKANWRMIEKMILMKKAVAR